MPRFTLKFSCMERSFMPSIKGIEPEIGTSAKILQVMRKFVCFVPMISQIGKEGIHNMFNPFEPFASMRT